MQFCKFLIYFVQFWFFWFPAFWIQNFVSLFLIRSRAILGPWIEFSCNSIGSISWFIGWKSFIVGISKHFLVIIFLLLILVENVEVSTKIFIIIFVRFSKISGGLRVVDLVVKTDEGKLSHRLDNKIRFFFLLGIIKYGEF